MFVIVNHIGAPKQINLKKDRKHYFGGFFFASKVSVEIYTRCGKLGHLAKIFGENKKDIISVSAPKNVETEKYEKQNRENG